MTTKNLGRGLSAFLDVDAQNLNVDDNDIVKIEISNIKPNPFQPRQVFNEENLQSLADSIKRKGILQPVLVIKLEDSTFQLVAGERRLRASKIAGLKEIPAIITNMGKEDQLEIAILENIQRENLNPLEEAEAYKRLIDEFHHTQDELSEILGKSRSHVANTLRLLSLPVEVKQLLKDGKLTFGHARALVGSDEATNVAKQIVQQALNVRQTESIVRSRRSGQRQYADPEILNVAGQISSLIGLDTNIRLKAHGGIVEINFSNFEELDALIRRLGSREV